MMPVDLNDMVEKSPVQNKMLYVLQTRMPDKFNPRFAQLQKQRMSQFIN